MSIDWRCEASRTDATELAELEVHAAFEQDDRHTQADQFGQFPRRHREIDQPGDRAEDEAAGDQDDDGRQANLPGQPLAGQTRGQNDQEDCRDMHWLSASPSVAAGIDPRARRFRRG